MADRWIIIRKYELSHGYSSTSLLYKRTQQWKKKVKELLLEAKGKKKIQRHKMSHKEPSSKQVCSLFTTSSSPFVLLRIPNTDINNQKYKHPLDHLYIFLFTA
jgi:hypothetical protein